jgi:hypothetical protein
MIDANKDNWDRQTALAHSNLMKENERLRDACKESYLFLTAPLNSPRLWPTARGNLTKMLAEALGEDKP